MVSKEERDQMMQDYTKVQCKPLNGIPLVQDQIDYISRMIIITHSSHTVLQRNSVITNSLGLVKFVRHNQEFIITRVVYVLNMDLGLKQFVHYYRRFVITEFVITESHCIWYFGFCQSDHLNGLIILSVITLSNLKKLS